ncbi:MAG TPA: fatty acid desaturase [Kofleriaceae bacterium]|nr:fatty acid desaturase [Casimicrobiaceae bacterium]HVK86383.1 fatty acid desaturase [Kofleriaceae bacterium]
MNDLDSLLDFLARGLIPMSWWGYVVVTLVLTHVTIASVTIYLHRCQAHRALDLHPAVGHFFRFWLWLTTGMVTKEWAAIHRKHHAKVETADDPHSPVTRGLSTVLWTGAELYRAESRNPETIEHYGHGTPDDWVERTVYTPYSWQGVGLMLAVNLVLFGALGATIWAIQMMWIPFFAAGIVNGVAHWWGYRNYATGDTSTNLVPWGLIIGGEELHNNHHAYGTSAKFSAQWYEFDLGWLYIRALSALGLAKIRRVAPKLKLDASKPEADHATLQAIITHRYQVATTYARALKAACRSEIDTLRERARGVELPSRARLKRWLTDPDTLPEGERSRLAHVAEHSKTLAKVVAMRAELSALWSRSTESSEQLLARLQDWCRRAEASGIAPLAQFSLKLKRYA